MSAHEAARIKRVYSEYDRNSVVQARRSLANFGQQHIATERLEAVGRIVRQQFTPLSEKRVLDAGCGNGTALAELIDFGAKPTNLYGIDLLPDRIETARKLFPFINFSCVNAEYLNFPTGFFDLILSFTVFSSILEDSMAAAVAAELNRVLAPGGAILWYDFRYDNPQNPNVRGIGKHFIRTLFPTANIRLQTITLWPWLARRLGYLTTALYPAFAAVPPLRTHYIGLISKLQ